eukprot:UN23695
MIVGPFLRMDSFLRMFVLGGVNFKFNFQRGDV